MSKQLHVSMQGKIKTKYQLCEKCENFINHFRECYLDHARDPGKDNVIIIMRKHTMSTTNKYHNLSYQLSRIQSLNKYIKVRWLNRQFPDHQVIVELHNPNSIDTFN